jgi:hypothetical protein
MISVELNIPNLDDFGLFLDYAGEPRMLDSHEPIYEAMVQVEAEVKQLSDNSILNTIK